MAKQLVPSSFTTTPSWTYDVFLSFRGEDTRYNFTDHLYQALVRHGIHTFIDHSELPIGEEIAPTLLEAIENSRISIIIFSENYASSRWCLDELVHILECRKSKGQMTRPIFYKVDPSDVRHQRNSYGAAFADHSRKYENNLEKVQRWRTALTEAADLKGDTLNNGDRYEATFINRIVEEISIQVSNRTHLNVARFPVGIESCAKEVEELLGVGGNDRRVVGIWGTSGIGKTTIARAVYNASAHKFEGSCFLGDVRESSTSREGVIKLQNTLLSKVLRGTEWEIVNVHQGINLIKNRLRQKKILLILDDVDKLEQLKDWVDVNCFGEGSRVIITTKDRRLLKFYGGQWIYEVQKLRDGKALELFSWNAFERNRPPDDYLSLARRAIVHAQGLPLALNLMGSYLRNESIGRWQDVLNSYDSYFGEPYTDIEKILRKIYDALDNGMQQVFLDIACFFKGENKDWVLQILRSSTLNVRQDCIEVLVEKAIITIEYNQILMHDLLQKMGKHIVYEESPTEPGKRSRLWHHEDVCDVLIDCRGTEKIRGIVVNLPKPDEIPLKPKSFLKMVNLEFFINRNAHFSGRVDYLSNSLRLIEFGGQLNIDQKHTYVLNLRSNFHPRHLVKLDVSYSGIRQLKEFKNLAKLTHMDLRGCEFLEKIPDLSGCPNIKALDLSECTSLVEVDDSVGFLDKLQELLLDGCSKLTRFATRLGSRSLYYLSLKDCRRLESFPEIECKMESLHYLNIEGSGIRELPSSIAYLTGLTYLEARGCELQNVPDLSGCLNIENLDLGDCTSLVEVHDSVGFLDKLQELLLDGCSKLTRFATRLGSRSLYYLSLEDCRRLESFPEIECKMESLHHLNIEGSGIRELPSSIAYLTGLTYLKARGCELQNVPDLSGCLNIEKLDLGDCTSLVEVHDSVGFLDKLRELLLDGCSKLTRFATRLGSRSLHQLSLQGCKRLESFPEIEGNMGSLRYLNIRRSGIRELPSSIANLTGLQTLEASGCELQNVIDLCPYIKELDLSDCTSLVKVHDSVGFFDKLFDRCLKLTRFATILKSTPPLYLSLRRWTRLESLSESDFLAPFHCWSALTSLDMSRNNFVSFPDCISKVVNLETLFLRDCKRLREIPVLPPKLEELYLDDCTSLEKIPKLPLRLKRLNLCNCFGLSGDELAKLENNLLNEEIDPLSKLDIIYPGNEVPKWFSYTSNHPTTIQPLPKYEWDVDSEFRFEIPLKLQVGETLSGLALSFVVEPSTLGDYFINPCFIINGEELLLHNILFRKIKIHHDNEDIKATHVRLALVGLRERFQKRGGSICQVVFRFQNRCPIKSCGVHCLLRNHDELLHPRGSSDIVDDEYDQQQQWLSSSSKPAEDHPKPRQIDLNVPIDIEEDEEQLHLSLRPTSSLGMRPRPRGSPDIVNDKYDQQQQWLSSSSEPADDRPKRWQIDLNVPFDIEEDEEQLHLPLRPTSSLGMRPRPRGSSDIVYDEYDQQQQWLSSSSEPADDHPKCWQIDLNVPLDIEEDEEQLHLSLRPTSNLGMRPRPCGSSDIVNDKYD